MKWIGIALLATTLCLLGVQEGKRYKKKMALWQEMERLAAFYITELRFTADEPIKIFGRYLQRFDISQDSSSASFEEAFWDFLSTTLQCEWSVGEESIVSFIEGLGVTDLEGQLSHCGRFERVCAQLYEQVCETYRSKGKLHQKLWMLAGAATTVLFL